MSIRNRQPSLAACWPLVIATFAVGTDAWIVAGFLSAMALDLRVGTGAAGWTVTVFALSYAVSAPLLAAWTSRRPRRALLVVALVLLAAANLASAVAPDLVALLLARAAAGAAASLVTPTAGVIAAALAPQSHRARALALVVTGLTLATAIGVPLGAAMSSALSWRSAVAAVAGLCLLAAGAVHLLCPETSGTAPSSVRSRFSPLVDPQIRRTLLLTWLGMAAAYAPYAFLGTVTDTRGVRLTAMLAAYGCGALGGSLASGPLTDRIGAQRTLMLAYSTMVGSMVVAALHGPLGIGLLAALAWGASSWAQTPPQQHRLLALAPTQPAMVIGLNASALYLGVATGTSLGSVLLPVGVQAVIGAAAVLAVGARILNSFAVSARPEDAHDDRSHHALAHPRQS